MEQNRKNQVEETRDATKSEVATAARYVGRACARCINETNQVDDYAAIICVVVKDPKEMSLEAVNEWRIKMGNIVDELLVEYYEGATKRNIVNLHIELTRQLYELCNTLESYRATLPEAAE
jgi:Zn-dependent M32 family carboxypeptidase